MHYIHTLLPPPVRLFLLTACVSIFSSISGSAQLEYQRPPQEIVDVALAPPTPQVRLSPDGSMLLLLEQPGYPGIEELAQPELRLAGLRINPRTHGPSRSVNFSALYIQRIGEEAANPVAGLPDKARIGNVGWAPDSRHLAFTIEETSGISLWIASATDHRAQRITDARINDALAGSPYTWSDEGRTIYYRVRTEVLELPPATDAEIPSGPVVQENTAARSAIRTFQDLLQNAHDEKVFEYYATGRIMRQQVPVSADALPLQVTEEGMWTTFDPSPDGRYLFVSALQYPFSYLVPYRMFPQRYLILDNSGNIVKSLADIPLADNLPQGFGAVRTGPRNVQWRADTGAQLYWVEAMDEGDPRRDAEIRDRVFSMNAPFDGTPQIEVDCTLRFSGITFANDEIAVLSESWWRTRHEIVSTFAPGHPASKTIRYERSTEDRYEDPGRMVTRSLANGYRVLVLADGDRVYLMGNGASPEGDRPFVRSMSLTTGEVTELWRSEEPWFEVPFSFIDVDAGLLLTRRESQTVQPNYFLRNLQTGDLMQVTHFEHPYPSLKDVVKTEIRYLRDDGVELSGNLYLPPGYTPESDGPLPALVWAYPREFISADAAGQITGSPHAFIRVGWGSPVYWVLRGYAVLDNASMPIVGADEEEPNDSFRQQLVMNAKAAVDKLVAMGVADRERIAVGGHSYGAFMTANLLAHSDLFAAGIARSGAYNRTLTPFGFQREERTYWDAPEVYNAMSPFMHADKITAPILLIHGAADNNSGTFPMQSERYYAALRGMGATVRLVMLPHESHGYRAEESILHTLWEQDQWLEKYVKNKETVDQSVAPARP